VANAVIAGATDLSRPREMMTCWTKATDRRQLACIGLLDRLDLLRTLAHLVEHGDAGLEQRAAVVRRLDP
jgi:hypothetical protein